MSTIDFLRRAIAPGRYANVVAIDPETGAIEAQAFKADTVETVDAFLRTFSNCNLYWSTNPLNSLINKKATKADVAEMAYIHVDIDRTGADVLDQINGYKLKPTITVMSGGGYQLFWKLREPIRANGNLVQLEAANKRVEHDFAADHCHNLDRIMRLPGTTNFPTAKKRAKGRTEPAPAVLVEFDESRVYELADFPPMVVEKIADPHPPTVGAEDRSRNLLRRVAADVRRGLADYQIHAAHRNHPHVQDQSDPARAVQRAIDRARAEQIEGRSCAIKFLTIDEFAQQPTGDTQIEGLDPGESIVVVFGPPKEGKTSCALDLTLSAAHGIRDWHGLEISRPLRVAYLLGEGIRGAKVRVRAWIEQHDNLSKGQFLILPAALSLPDNVSQIIEQLTEFRPDIVVTDTLNAYFGTGSENKTEDMTAFVSALRRLRDELHTSVHVIHHTGHGDQTRERGSIVLRGSADVLVHVAKDASGTGNIAFQVIAARDMETMVSPIALTLHSVDTAWTDSKGRPLSACVVRAADVAVSLPGRVARPLGDAQAAVLGLVRELTQTSRDGLVARCDVAAAARERGLDRRRVSQAWAPLSQRGLIKLLEPGAVKLVSK